MRLLAFASALAALGAIGVVAAGLDPYFMVPLNHEAIQYEIRPVDDPVARLDRKLAKGEVKLAYDEQFGYLRSVLKELDLPLTSQLLVFSKTSFQSPHINYRMPRALYFKDDVSVGYVRSGEVLEFAATDPKQGVVFYTLDQEPTAQPRIVRRDICLQCHQSGGTLGVPGLVVRSVFPDPTGNPLFQAGTFTTDHRSPLSQRWGGWYVTGTHGSAHHMGNAIVPDRGDPTRLDTSESENVESLRGRLSLNAYLTPYSDIVALMVLEHQTRMTNLLTRVGFETRIAEHDLGAQSDAAKQRIDVAVEELLKYMLFTDEAKLTAPIAGVSGYAESFAKVGPQDGKDRSLRDFDLHTRMFRYPCSYMIYSDAFDQMPPAARERIFRRLWEILKGKDTTDRYASLNADTRQAIFEILRDTKKNLPAYWNQPQETFKSEVGGAPR